MRVIDVERVRRSRWVRSEGLAQDLVCVGCSALGELCSDTGARRLERLAELLARQAVPGWRQGSELQPLAIEGTEANVSERGRVEAHLGVCLLAGESPVAVSVLAPRPTP